jgi:hypothetical protein
LTLDRRRVVAGLGLALLAGTGARAGAAGAASDSLAFAELYSAQTVRGLELSAKTRALAGKPVQMLGYMAPPLKADVEFFVLTRSPVALCPFCSSDADWPSDIVVVYPRERSQWTEDGLPVAVAGVFEVGARVDARTGFVSLVRIVDATVRTLR